MLFKRIYWDEIAQGYKAKVSDSEVVDVQNVIYVNFAGAADVSYRNEALSVNIDHISLASSNYREVEIKSFLTKLNGLIDDIAFVSDTDGLLQDTYSTIFVGNSGNYFDSFLDEVKDSTKAISETTGESARTSLNDNAFVFTQNLSLAEVITVIAAKAEQLSGSERYNSTEELPQISDYTKIIVDDFIITPEGINSEVDIAGKHYTGIASSDLNGVISVASNCTIVLKDLSVNYRIPISLLDTGVDLCVKLVISNLTAYDFSNDDDFATALYLINRAEVYDSKIINTHNTKLNYGAMRINGTAANVILDNLTFAGNTVVGDGSVNSVVTVSNGATVLINNIKLLTNTDVLYFYGSKDTYSNVTFTGKNIVNANIVGKFSSIDVSKAEFIFRDYSDWEVLKEQGFDTSKWLRGALVIAPEIAAASKLTFRECGDVKFYSGTKSNTVIGVASSETEMFFENNGKITVGGDFSLAKRMVFSGSDTVSLKMLAPGYSAIKESEAQYAGELIFNNQDIITVEANFSASNSKVCFCGEKVSFIGTGIGLTGKEIVIKKDLSNGPVEIFTGNYDDVANIGSLTIDDKNSTLTSYGGMRYAKIDDSYYVLKSDGGCVSVAKGFIISNEEDFNNLKELLFEHIDSFKFNGGTYTNTVYGMGKNVEVGDITVMKGFFGGSDDVKGNVTVSGTLTCEFVFGSGNIDSQTGLEGNSTISGSFNSKRVYGGGNVTGTSSITNDSGTTINGGTVSEIAAGGWQIFGNVGDNVNINGKTHLNITGGSVEYAVGSGMLFDSNITATHTGNSCVNISGGKIKNIFGGFMSTGEGKATLKGNTFINITATENIDITGDIFGGSNGENYVSGISKITFSGVGEKLTFDGVLRGDSSGAYGNKRFIDIGNTYLEFSSFHGNFNATILEYIDNVKFQNSTVTFADMVTGVDEIVNWEFEFYGSNMLNFNGVNDFTGDTLKVTGEGIGTIMCGGANAFTGFDGFKSVQLFGEDAVLTENKWRSSSYELQVVESEMKIFNLA